MPTLAKRLDRCMAEYAKKGWTYDQLSEESGVPRSTAVTYVNGNVNGPKEHIIVRLETALGIDPNSFETQDESGQQMTHCDRCRADQNEHNRRLREDFNERFAAMKESYDDRIAHINEKFTQRIDDMKAYQEKVDAINEKHTGDQIERLKETITVLTAENVRQQKRNRILLISLIILAGVVGILSIIDLSHEGIGWLPYILRFSSGASH